ncbi:MAG: hypothetical protein K2W96_28375, partial [Gemmataceae bacterium]|nr:hypothetical protein [Gemmataceae bacterium]
LVEAVEPILVALKKADVRKVGVLPFEVKKGARPASLDSSPLSSGIAPRLENALLLRQGNGKSPLVVLRGASHLGAWRTKDSAREALFAQQLLPAWGGEDRARADAYLFGTVSHKGGEAEVSVSLVRARGEPEKVHSFKVKADRALLRDLGYAVRVPLARAIKKDATAEELDKESAKVIEDDEGGKKPEVPLPVPTDVAGLRLEIEYDGDKQEITALPGVDDGAKQAVYQVAAAKPGQKVVIWLTRISEGKEKLGAVLRVNGKSVYREEEAEGLFCKKWIYDESKKGVREDFRGFYDKVGKELKVRPWKALTADEAKGRAAELGPRVGWIDLEVFATREKGEPADSAGPVFSVRSVPKGRAKTLREAREALAKANGIQLAKYAPRDVDGVLVADVKALPAGPVGTDKLPNPVRLGGLSIRYVEGK